ncbi:MAG TPA: CocE/NonD family hydrolase [Gaiellaceae bacterium]|nr:CocE/NonD family hydrolase [Gaiellaceae bacterium]
MPSYSWLTLGPTQARLLAAVLVAYDPPVLGAGIRMLVGAPRVEESEVAGAPATIFRPARGQGPWPALVVFPGVTRMGRRHPALVGLGRGLASIGALVVVAEPEGLARGELTGTTVTQALAAAEAVAARRDAQRGRIALVGVSGGGTLALLAAAAPQLAARVRAVAALAPVCDIVEAIRFVTTGAYRENDDLVGFATGDFFKLVVARSVVACLPEGRDRTALLGRLRALADYGDTPLEELRTWPLEALDSGARAVVRLLANDDPTCFDELFSALPREVRESVESLSATAAASRIGAPVELVVARTDKYIPLADAISFAKACSTPRLTILESLEHAVPRASLFQARELAKLDGVLVRLLAASYSRA